MKYVKLTHATPMNSIETFEGEFIEEKIARVVENREPIEDGAPIIYTERKDGVLPAYNIRTDKWDIALTAMDQVNKNWQTRRKIIVTLTTLQKNIIRICIRSITKINSYGIL